MKLFRRWFRLSRHAVMTVLSLPARVDLIGRLSRAFAFPQHEWARRLRRNLASEPETVTWQQAVNPLFLIKWGTVFFWKWLLTRPYMALAPAIPALLVLVVLAATAVVIARRDSGQTQTIYLDKLRAAMASGETEVAAVAAQRLLELDPENLEHQYQLAMLDDELGRTESARRAIFRLAIQKQYGPAALWMLKALVYDESAKSDSESGELVRRTSWGKAEQQLCHQCATVAMSHLPSDRARFAQKLYAGFLAENGFYGDALRHYQELSESEPSVNLAAALLADRVKEYDSAQRFAEAAIGYLKPKFLAQPTAVQLRLQYAQALVLDEQFDEAYRLLVDGYKLTPEPILLTATAEALVFRAKNLQRAIGDRESVAKRSEFIFDAQKIAPQSPLVIESVVELLIDCAEAEDDGLKNVRRDLLRGLDPASKHFVEGTVLMIRGEEDKARSHLELAASQAQGNLAGMLNNLAYALGRSDEKYLPRALELSELALEKLPGHPSLLETRGQILLRMERYHDAIADLEKALADPTLRPMVHASLARAYEALELDDLAEQHHDMAHEYAGEKTPSP
ncbi:hypothetical protein [Stieleria mannarensis]|uniref:hypothetical protein n=1 Tax=Stieleria mannarensis TaxID=2755585 RepID=UPI0016048BAC|nr:hypothetical protein [Rhodopirellula sp. JC639]